MHILLDSFQAVTNMLMRIPFWSLRRLYCSLFARLQKGSFIAYKCDIRFPKRLSVGKNSIVNKYCTLDCRGGDIVIGDNVDIAQETNIWTLEHDVSAIDHGTKGGAVVIDHHVWVASRVTILPGVHIGFGAVIASRAVVTKNIPPMEIWGGVPARKIGVRKNDCTYELKFRPLFQ